MSDSAKAISSETDLARLPAGALVEGEVFVDRDFASLPKIELYKCRFDNCRFADASFSRVVFESCEFVGCDLSHVSWGNSSLRGVRFVDTKLLGVNFGKANDNPDVVFERCFLRYAVFDGVALRGVRFVDCQLVEASFVETDLQDADFSGSTLTHAMFRRCALAGADLSTTSGLSLDPAQNQAKDAFISVDAAVEIARAVGVRVAGYDEPRGSKKKRR